MRDALLQDLSALNYDIYTTVDARLAPPAAVSCVTIDCNAWQIWEAQIIEADAVWLIAPETDGLLYCLTQLAVRHGKRVLGCGLESIKTCSDKMATYLALQKAKIATIPTYTLENWPKKNAALKTEPSLKTEPALETEPLWLAKPNDGAGCSDTVCFNQPDDLQDWLLSNHKQHTHVIQAYHSGVPASISCVMHRGKAQVLSCNEQKISFENHVLKFHGCVVNGMKVHWGAFQKVAQDIAQAMPRLAGYVGIDVIVNAQQITVVEINPRLTTSYVALRKATGINVAALVINTLTKPDEVYPPLSKNKVLIHV